MKKITKKIISLCLAIVFLFVNFFIAIVIHENTHKFDYISIEKSEDSISYIFCKMMYENHTSFGGCYHFIPLNEQEREKALIIQQKTEYNAQINTFIFLFAEIFIVLIISLIILKNKKIRRRILQ